MIWLLYLAAVVASVSGQDERASLIHDPLKFNPHDRVHKYDEHDKRQNEILQEFNSPDYHQPTLILDYRYMRTGGREYIQGPGGQYIILPRNVKSPQHTKFKNFDELLDYVQHRQYNKGHIYREDYGWDEHRYENHQPREHQQPSHHEHREDHLRRYDHRT